MSAFDETVAKLAIHPYSGQLVRSRRRDLAGVRRAAVRGFERILIFYLPTGGGIDVVRVVHGSRDLEQMLDVVF